MFVQHLRYFGNWFRKQIVNFPNSTVSLKYIKTDMVISDREK